MLGQIRIVFIQKFPKEKAEKVVQDLALEMPEIDQLLQRFQDPKEADKLLKIESDIEEIQEMLSKTMTDILERGESLDTLMKNSEDISNMAYNFYQNSRRANQKCCSIY